MSDHDMTIFKADRHALLSRTQSKTILKQTSW